MTTGNEPSNVPIKAPVEKVRLVDEGRVEITFLIDELVKRIDIDQLRPLDSCGGCDSCN
ncbi:hypothetical protein QLQ12_32520 [Actinoplanes sp. NEAU-A12]|uniref:2Fe-2S iron-sulfur cluster binding domain-containing protein n=1 Tax=Actinoplanes sandaracinus TaxID=3045177 RepID=A0ABT6WUC6_9ACTN|nr:hypothetical protein [Actinoplanes sandaracinus]MDI6103344.1 hypothetical protein [Actinoplanes sandaracinus]